MDTFRKDIIEVLKKHNVINEQSIRDHQIRERYNELRSIKNEDGTHKYSAKQARETISDEFYLTDKRIQQIVYKKFVKPKSSELQPKNNNS